MLVSDILLENVTGKFAIVYHRTHSHENIESIKKEGFMSGPRAMYGAGIYATYSITSQFAPYMVEQYGDFIIKNRINLHGFLIFDATVASAVYGSDCITIEQQVKKHFKEGKYHYKSFADYQEMIDDGEPTSTVAREIIENKLVIGMRGVVYTGRLDGRCAVCYESDTIIPISWAKVSLEDIQNMRSQKMVGTAEKEYISNIEWTRILDKKLVARSITPSAERSLVTNPSLIKTIKNPTEAQMMAAVTADPKTIRFIKNPSDNVQFAATRGDGDVVNLIEKPSPYAVIWPLMTNIDNKELLARVPQETLIAALKLKATILPAIMRGNANPKEPTPEQWAAAWEADDAVELISIMQHLHPDQKWVDVSNVAIKSLCKVMHDHPAQLYRLDNVPPKVVAAAVLSPEEGNVTYQLALTNCAGHNRSVDVTSIPPEKLTEIIQKFPVTIFAIKDASTEMVAIAMTADQKVARQLDSQYDLPPELKKLVKNSGPIFKLS